MAQTLGGVGGKVEDVIKLVLLEQPGDERLIFHLALHEFRARGDIFGKPARKIVQRDHGVPHFQKLIADV